MRDKIYELECWRDRWFYKFGSIYTGPFPTREAAATAAEIDLAPLDCETLSVPASTSPWRKVSAALGFH